MIKETMGHGAKPIPTPDIQKPAGDTELASQVHKTIAQFTAASQPRHPLGKGIPANSPLLG